MDFPVAHRVKRHADVVGVRRGARTDGACASLPNEPSIMRLVAAVLLEANDASQLERRYLSIEAFAGVSTIEAEVDRFALAPPVTTPILAPSAA
jgi:putative transposase